jgi:hypothetical protein
VVVVTPHDTTKVVRIPCRLLCTIIVVDVDENPEGEDTADFVMGFGGVNEFRDFAVDFGVVVGETLGRKLCGVLVADT